MPMLIVGLEFLREQLDTAHPNAKLVFNEKGAIFFPVSQQHRDQKAAGVSYEDNYAGNALAAMLSPHRIEVRFHEAFSDQQVAAIFRKLTREKELAPLASWQVFYQGRRITV